MYVKSLHLSMRMQLKQHTAEMWMKTLIFRSSWDVAPKTGYVLFQWGFETIDVTEMQNE